MSLSATERRVAAGEAEAGVSAREAPLVLLNASHTVAGGGLTYLQGIIRELGRSGEFRWILLAPERSLSALETPPGWIVRPSPSLGFWALHVWEQTVLPLVARCWGVSAVLCNANYVPLAAPRPVPIVHSASGRAKAQTLREKIYWRTLDAMTKLSVRRSSHCIAVADVLAEDYDGVRIGGGEHRVFLARPGKPRAASAVRKDPDLVVAVGNILPTKRHDILVRAMELIVRERPGTRLEIMGHPFDQALARSLHRLIGERGLQDHVLLRGFIPHDQLMRRIREASILVSASVLEASSLVALEAMAVGTAVVLADTRAQRELAEPAAVFVPNDQDAVQGYATAVLELLEHDERRQRMAAAGRQRAEQFTWGRTASVIVSALRAATAGQEDGAHD